MKLCSLNLLGTMIAKPKILAIAMVMNEALWEHRPHGADVIVYGQGRSKAEAFEQAAMALTAIVTDPDAVAVQESIEVSCDAPDDELLLVEWLNLLIYEMATRKMLFGRFQIRTEDHKLVGRAWGEPINLERHDPGVEVKGATCTALKVARDDSGLWRAQCVVDV